MFRNTVKVGFTASVPSAKLAIDLFQGDVFHDMTDVAVGTIGRILYVGVQLDPAGDLPIIVYPRVDTSTPALRLEAVTLLGLDLARKIGSKKDRRQIFGSKKDRRQIFLQNTCFELLEFVSLYADRSFEVCTYVVCRGHTSS